MKANLRKLRFVVFTMVALVSLLLTLAGAWSYARVKWMNRHPRLLNVTTPWFRAELAVSYDWAYLSCTLDWHRALKQSDRLQYAGHETLWEFDAGIIAGGISREGWYISDSSPAVWATSIGAGMPPLLFIAVTTILPVLWTIDFVRRGLPRRRRKRGLCSECGYDLRAHKPGERCPECGTTVAHRRIPPNPLD